MGVALSRAGSGLPRFLFRCSNEWTLLTLRIAICPVIQKLDERDREGAFIVTITVSMFGCNQIRQSEATHKETGNQSLDPLLSLSPIHIHYLHPLIICEPQPFILQWNRDADAKGVLR